MTQTPNFNQMTDAQVLDLIRAAVRHLHFKTLDTDWFTPTPPRHKRAKAQKEN
ncbi:hypothetical protein DOU02_06665 [Clavibacter michiganensis subsp. michiganensis]|uniref:hypothetical protein n=1 Tax=Clavibacter michiganensis TaxID=28447 RepID=UPI001303DD20|nr:hypothetical protein [Clavibacter michiganensis]KAF0258760.1 hypothetical protein DOU02_06665 [Clavibacter michiganensis subsp. michiganensis]